MDDVPQGRRTLPVWVRPRPMRRRWSVPLHVLAALFAIVSLVGLIARAHEPTVTWQLAFSAFAPYLMVWCLPALIVWVALRHWIPAAVALVLLVLTVVSQAPLYTSDDAPAGATTITVMTANLRLGMGDPRSVVRAVKNRHVDVLAVEELTDSARGGLQGAGLDTLLPYHLAAPAGAGFGTGLWSRYPLLDPVSRHDFFFNMITGRIHPAGLPVISVAAIHMCGPYPEAACWVSDMRRFPIVLRELAAEPVALVAGDFNATPDVVQFRRLLTDGYADATQQAGAGWLPTYPANRWYPTLIPIDHVLTRNAVATDVDRVTLRNSDHRGLVVRVAVRPDR